MKKLFYYLLKPLIRAGFYCYYQRVRMEGMEHIPQDKPVMLLPNHQNALLDPLLVAAYSRGKRPYFLTRSDVFKGGFLLSVFDALRMIPIYRLRDGRNTLHRNQVVFDRCARLLSQGEHLLLFPEANHNLRRQVRPLSKGFTRIVLHTLASFPQTDLQLLPVGINYQGLGGFPDRVAFRFGKPVPASSLSGGRNSRDAAASMKEHVFQSLTGLTTHIPPETDYERRIAELDRLRPDYTDPGPINRYLGGSGILPKSRPASSGLFRLWDGVFRLVNLPVWLPWQWAVRPKIWEPEFTDTFRFLYGMLVFPIYLALLVLGCWIAAGPANALGVAAGILVHNFLYVKLRPVQDSLHDVPEKDGVHQ